MKNKHFPDNCIPRSTFDVRRSTIPATTPCPIKDVAPFQSPRFNPRALFILSSVFKRWLSNAPTGVSPRTSNVERRTRKSSAFTLIELLVVIAIIALLAGLLMPAIQGARDKAKQAKAKAFMNQMGASLTAYYNEYGYWPSVPTYPTTDAELTTAQLQALYQMLGGSNLYLDGVTPGGNSRQIVFFNYKNSDLGPVTTAYLQNPGGSAPTNLVNAWGNSFRVAFDYDGNNQTIPTGGVFTNLTLGYAIYTVGSKGNTWTWCNSQN